MRNFSDAIQGIDAWCADNVYIDEPTLCQLAGANEHFARADGRNGAVREQRGEIRVFRKLIDKQRPAKNARLIAREKAVSDLARLVGFSVPPAAIAVDEYGRHHLVSFQPYRHSSNLNPSTELPLITYNRDGIGMMVHRQVVRHDDYGPVLEDASDFVARTRPDFLGAAVIFNAFVGNNDSNHKNTIIERPIRRGVAPELATIDFEHALPLPADKALHEQDPESIEEHLGTDDLSRYWRRMQLPLAKTTGMMVTDGACRRAALDMITAIENLKPEDINKIVTRTPMDPVEAAETVALLVARQQKFRRMVYDAWPELAAVDETTPRLPPRPLLPHTSPAAAFISRHE